MKYDATGLVRWSNYTTVNSTEFNMKLKMPYQINYMKLFHEGTDLYSKIGNMNAENNTE
jgi:hypothetical protein